MTAMRLVHSTLQSRQARFTIMMSDESIDKCRIADALLEY
jgi:hypothetical protein